jgi:hypothetical protein
MRARIALIIGMVLTSGMCFTGLAASNLSTDGSFFNFSAQNDSYAQVLDIFRQQTGLEYDIPPEMRGQKIPLVEIRGLTLRSALVKVLEGSNFDYILICSPDDPEKVRKLLVTGRSVKVVSTSNTSSPAVSAAMSRRVNRQIVEDPFGGGADMGFEEGSANDPMMMAPVPENPPGQGVAPGQPAPVPSGPQQGQPLQTQPMQSAPGLQQPSLGQPLPPMTPQQVTPGFGQQTPQGNSLPNRRTPF